MHSALCSKPFQYFDKIVFPGDFGTFRKIIPFLTFQCVSFSGVNACPPIGVEGKHTGTFERPAGTVIITVYQRQHYIIWCARHATLAIRSAAFLPVTRDSYCPRPLAISRLLPFLLHHRACTPTTRSRIHSRVHPRAECNYRNVSLTQ